jgi:hypothetical protein
MFIMVVLISIMALTILSLAIQQVASKLHDYRPVFKYHILNTIVYLLEEIVSAPFVLIGGATRWALQKLGFFRK